MTDTMRKALPLAGTALVLAACLLAAGCTGQAPGGNDTVPAIDLNGTAWDLVSYAQNGSMVNALNGTPVTLAFGENTTAGGSAGCNRYSASYTVNGTAITFGPAVSTLMYCMKPGVMEQENTYLGLLGTVASFSIAGEKLTLLDANGTKILMFTKAVPPEPKPLVGTNWTLESLHTGDAVSSVIAGSEITAVFDGDGNIAGSAGCNRYFATYNLSGSSLTFGPVGSTKMACHDPEGIMEQENTYLSLLQAVRGYTIEGDQLEVLDGRGLHLLVFTAKV